MSARKVYGRREVEIDQAAIIVELRADGLHLWRKRARTRSHLAFRELWKRAEGGQKEWGFL